MSKRSLVLIGFALAAAAQLAVPAWMIMERERTLSEGEVFRFKTQPVDPADAFRGRYVWLRLEPNTVALPAGESWNNREKAFAVLGQGADGFAVVKRLSRTRPEDEPSLQVRTQWMDMRERTMHIEWLGMDRFYMTELKAPEAERAYREHSSRGKQDCHVTIRVHGSCGVIENLFIGDQPIQAWLKATGAVKGRRNE